MKTKQSLTAIILLLLECLFSSVAQGNDTKYDVAFYDRWTDKTSKQLTELAQRYMDAKDMTDSALVCYTIVANRYYEHHPDPDELYLCAQAMANMGYLYCNHYLDYQKAYSYLQQALDIAEKHRMKRLLPYIYLNMGVLYGTYEDLCGHNTYSRETLHYLQKAYQTALDNKEWRAALYCMNDMLDIMFNDNKDVSREQKQCSQLREWAKDSLAHYTSLLSQGIAAYQHRDYAQAMNCFRRMQGIGFDTEHGNQDLLRLKALRYQAAVLHAQGKQAEGMALLAGIAAEAESRHLQHIKVWIYKIMYEQLAQEGHATEADRYQLKYYQAKEQLSQSGHIEDIKQTRFLYQLKTVNDKVRQLSLKRQQQQVVFIVSGIVALLVIVVLLLSLRYYRRQKNFIQNLYEKNMTLLQMREDGGRGQDEGESHSAATEDSKRYNLDDQSKEDIYKRVSSIINDTEAICSPDFSVKQLCDRIGSNTTYVSQVINEKYGMNFKTLLNERRVAEACRRLSDTRKYGHLTIEAIATSVGFKSRTNFALVFKRSTGLSPSEFQRAAARKL